MSNIEGTVSVVDQNMKHKKFDLIDLFDIDEANLTSDYATQASTFAYFSSLLALADKRLADAKMLVDVEYATADQHYRNELNRLGEKYTEAVVRSMIIQDDDYSTALSISSERTYEVGVLKAIVNAFRMRAEMLVSLGAHMRQEMGMTSMTMKQREMDSTVNKVKSVIKDRKKS